MTKKQQVSVGAFILKTNTDESEVLLVRRSQNDDFMPGCWELPGGGTEYGEEPQDGLKREIQEECGIDIEVLQPLTTATYYMNTPDEEIQRIEIIFKCSVSNKAQQIQLSDEHDDYEWVKLSDISKRELSEFMAKVVKQVASVLK